MHTGCPVIKGVKWTGALKRPGNWRDDDDDVLSFAVY
jgi:hypothetical protein